VQRERVAALAAASDDQGVRLLSRLLDARFDPAALPAALSAAQTARDPVALAEAAWLQARYSNEPSQWQRALDLARSSGVPRSEARVAEDWLSRADAAHDAQRRQDLQQRIRAWRDARDDATQRPEPPP
jgi:hypothetical protein